VGENTKQREAVDRRRFLKGAATVAWAAPVIATLSASPAYAQVECTKSGKKCGSQQPQGSGNCPGTNCCTGLNCRPSGTRDCICS